MKKSIKKALPLFFSFAFLFSFIFLPSKAQYSPFIIYGIVYYDGIPVKNANITVINERTGEKLYNVTNSIGAYSVVLADLPSGWKDKDKIKIIGKKGDLIGVNFTLANVFSSNQRVDIYLAPPPKADFFYFPENPEANQEIKFYDNSSSQLNIIFYYWNFDDGNISNEKNPTHIYKKGGNYSVSFKIKDEFGREDIVTKIIHIKSREKAEEISEKNMHYYYIYVIIIILITITIMMAIWKKYKK